MRNDNTKKDFFNDDELENRRSEFQIDEKTLAEFEAFAGVELNLGAIYDGGFWQPHQTDDEISQFIKKRMRAQYDAGIPREKIQKPTVRNQQMICGILTREVIFRENHFVLILDGGERLALPQHGGLNKRLEGVKMGERVAILYAGEADGTYTDARGRKMACSIYQYKVKVAN